MEIANKVALVTGAKRIGLVVATELASRGADVALSYARSKAEAEEGAARIKALGRRAEIVQADLTQPSQCDSLIASVVERLGRLDILINMASVYVARPFDQLTAENWDATVNVDLRASFLCARAAAPHMKRQGGGRIVNFSDWLSRSGRPRYRDYLPYYVAKTGVIGLTEALALELAGDNILVNAVAPGPILAPPETSEEDKRLVEQATPLGRWGGELEIAKGVLAFIESDFITGETLRVDGGRHLK